MADKGFIMDLGKLLIAAAWADGRLTNQEINALKELLFLLPEITGEEWMELELYMATPVEKDERQQLLHRVLAGMTRADQKALALKALEGLLHTEGAEKEAEARVVKSLQKDIEAGSTGLWAHLRTPLRWALKARSAHYADGEPRESRLEDFIKNSIYVQASMAMQAQGRSPSLSDSEVRKVCLAAGLMARVAWVDQTFCQQERHAMIRAMTEEWRVPESEATLIVEISRQRILKGLDAAQLTREFRDRTTLTERQGFIKVLFGIANAAGKTSSQEIEEIRAIAKALELGHQEFIHAKLSIPKADRGGL